MKTFLYSKLRLLKKLVSTTNIQEPLKLAKDNLTIWKESGQLEIGRFTYGFDNSTFQFHNPNEKIKIGSFCSFAGRVVIFAGGEHDYNRPTTFPVNFFLNENKNELNLDAFTKGETIIGNDVWLGFDCLVKSGVFIGDGAVVGSKSVVTKDIPPYAIVAGNPARIIKYRFDQAKIDKLLDISWWNWSEEKIRDQIELLTSNIDDFIIKNEKK
jgi:acetyltransferase-like isoleucine patch superfamily enzyme